MEAIGHDRCRGASSPEPESGYEDRDNVRAAETGRSVSCDKLGYRPSKRQRGNQVNISRRRFLQGTSVGLLVSSFVTPNSRVHAAEAPAHEIQEIKSISRHPGIYYGWPTVGINYQTNELYVVASGGREAHRCPFGRVDFFRSKDLGETWTWPRTIFDGPSDDRDAGLLVTRKGTILVTFYADDQYRDLLAKELECRLRGETPRFDDDKLARWQAVEARMTDEDRKKELGCWMIRSTDHGLNWSVKYPTLFNNPHGPIECSDGRLLYPGRNFFQNAPVMGVVESTDDGATWNYLSSIPPRRGDDAGNCHELHGVEAADGTIIVQIRNHNLNNLYETLQTESADGGKTWSEIHSTGVWGFPSHLLRLVDDRLLMTYGYRRDTLGNRARISNDHGKTWSEPITISDHADNIDFGYPSTVQLPNGSLLTVWYENMGMTCVRVAKWKLN